eukprot:TRINITY_DN10362_c0_g1_i1.p1 TRINITY_DN10362_c0_g1~~TRINITY_DN10362_c0_g1_i1.p1  ORF type:complete len:209 (-),score=48.09 TRINITY_DN10362_c0_g1_i1:96-722(-)
MDRKKETHLKVLRGEHSLKSHAFDDFPSLLNSTPTAQISLMIHGVLDRRVGYPSELSSATRSGAEKIQFSSLEKFVSLSIDKHLSTEEIEEDLEVLGVERERRECVASAVSERMKEQRAFLLDHVLSISQKRLIDFDWSLKVGVAGDTISALNEPIVHLQLRLQRTHDGPEEGWKEEVVDIELSQRELDKFIGVLDTVASNMRSIGVV